LWEEGKRDEVVRVHGPVWDYGEGEGGMRREIRKTGIEML
jgi:hypothetical protein